MLVVKDLVVSKVLRVAIYIRVSTKLQEDRYSLSAQTLELTRYANQQGWEIVDIFKDVDSGTKLDKDGLTALLDCVEKGQVDVVLCIEQDRLSRLDTIKWEYLKGVLRENNVKIAEPGHISDLTNADDEFFSDLKNLLARRSRLDLLGKMGRGQRQYTREGNVWGKQPEEYDYDSLTKTVSINPDREWIIPLIDRLYLDEKMGLQKIATHLNSISKTSNNKKWTAVQVRNKLRNPAYHGQLRKVFTNGETIIEDNVYPPLRSKETFDQIQERLDLRHTKIGFGEHHFLKSIEIHCADCGNILSIRKGSYVDGEYKHYLRHSNDYVNPCPSLPSVNTDRIRVPLLAFAEKYLTGEESVKSYFELEFEDDEKLKQLELETKKIEQNIKENHEKLDKLLGLYLSGKWSEEVLDKNKQEIENETYMLTEHHETNLKKIKLIKNNQYSFEAIIKHRDIIPDALAISALSLGLATEQDIQELLNNMFEKAIYNESEEILTLRLRLAPESIPWDVPIKLDPPNAKQKAEKLEAQRVRYNQTQELIDKQGRIISFTELVKLSPHTAHTLRKDEETFGLYKNIQLGKGSLERKEMLVKEISEILAKKPDIGARKIAKELSMSEKTVLKYIKEYNLRYYTH
ncbi:recombinase family protein [Lysinibacillus xylanilyticus]|uniref:recombinase family protein n=1 Tax=Lysinibacillus xylanilyticus TaxID=582475 RepID=UPI003D05D4ED